jgi:plastocyanin domain-containing protein
MDAAQIVVTIVGTALVGFIVWFFFGPKTAAVARVRGAGIPEIEIVVRGGYSPDRIEVRQGQPVRLTFLRQESNPCTEEVIFGDFGVARRLPEGERVIVEFTPDRVGEFPFHCSMNMVRGMLVVKPASSAVTTTR